MSQIVFHVSEEEILLVSDNLIAWLLEELLLREVILVELMVSRFNGEWIEGNYIEVGML